MAKPELAKGLGRLKAAGGHSAPEPVVSTSAAPAAKSTASSPAPSRQGLVQIAGHFQPAVRQQLATIGAQQSRTQLDLLAEALNDLFIKHGQSAIATVYGEGSKSKPRSR